MSAEFAVPLMSLRLAEVVSISPALFLAVTSGVCGLVKIALGNIMCVPFVTYLDMITT